MEEPETVVIIQEQLRAILATMEKYINLTASPSSIRISFFDPVFDADIDDILLLEAKGRVVKTYYLQSGMVRGYIRPCSSAKFAATKMASRTTIGP